MLTQSLLYMMNYSVKSNALIRLGSYTTLLLRSNLLVLETGRL